MRAAVAAPGDAQVHRLRRRLPQGLPGHMVEVLVVGESLEPNGSPGARGAVLAREELGRGPRGQGDAIGDLRLRRRRSRRRHHVCVFWRDLNG